MANLSLTIRFCLKSLKPGFFVTGLTSTRADPKNLDHPTYVVSYKIALDIVENMATREELKQ